MVCTSNQSYKHTSNCVTLINICFYPFMSTLITATLKKKTLSHSMKIGPVLASEDELDQTKLINLDMYNPFNT